MKNTPKLKFGFNLKGGWVEPRADLVKELEEGKAGKSITGQRKSSMTMTKRMLNSIHTSNENAELNAIPEQIDSAEMVGGIKEYYERLSQ